MPTIRCLLLTLSLLLWTGCATTSQPTPAAPPPPPTAMTPVAEAYGLSGWPQIERLDFTFNVKLPDREVQRRWTWEPQRDWVTLHGDARGGSVSYQRAALGPDTPSEIVQADKWFINDSYWLLFPFYAVWSQPVVEDDGMAPLPIGEGQARKITVSYLTLAAYTPGDVYELFVGDDQRIAQWRYLPRGDESKARPATWDQHAQLGPITVALDHRNADGTFRLWFTDVRAKVSGQGGLIQPRPVTAR